MRPDKTMLLANGLVSTFLLVLPSICHIAAKCVFNFDSKVRKSGNFSSPLFPAHYPSGVKCYYSFRGQDFEGLKINFFVFELEPPFRAGCLSDYLDVSAITISNEKTLLGRFCGSHIPNPLFTMTPHAELAFSSDHAVHQTGFLATYTFINEKDVPAPASSSDVAGCGGVVSGSGGAIFSPGYPTNYPANINCTWLLRAHYNRHIYVKVDHLQFFGSIADCAKSALYFYDGYGGVIDDHRYLKKLCGDLKYYGNVEDKTTLTTRNRLIIRFQTTEGASSTQHVVGFKLVWTEVTFLEPSKCDRFICQRSKYCINQTNKAAGSVSCNNTKNYCIDRSLVCDGLLNCSDDDDSDESDCYVAYIIGGAVGMVAMPLLLFLLTLCIVVYRRRRHVCKSASQSQHLTMQLRQLDHSPSCSSRQMANSYSYSSQRCDLLSSPTMPQFINGGSSGGGCAPIMHTCHFGRPTPV